MFHLLLISIFFLFSITVYIINDNNEKKEKLKRKLKNKEFLIHLFLVILVNIILYKSYESNHIFIKSLEKANLAVIIAVCAYIDAILLPFWIVLLLGYFLVI